MEIIDLSYIARLVRVNELIKFICTLDRPLFGLIDIANDFSSTSPNYSNVYLCNFQLEFLAF